eukprot:gene11351-2066_t
MRPYICLAFAVFVEAQDDPCLNGALCQNGGTCAVEADAATCACPPLWMGNTCEVSDDDCAPSPCLNSGTCTDIGPASYACDCPAGFAGADCSTETDPCSPSPCLNQGTCTSTAPGNYQCACPEAFQGHLCETPVDPCSPSPCLNSGTCIDEGSISYSCQCPTGTAGPECGTDIDLCASAPCGNQGTCVETGLSDFECACPLGFMGGLCETPISLKTSSVTVIGQSRKVRFAVREDPSTFFDVVFDSWEETLCDGSVNKDHSFNAFKDFAVADPVPARLAAAAVSAAADEDGGGAAEAGDEVQDGVETDTQDTEGPPEEESGGEAAVAYLDTMVTSFSAPLARPGNRPAFGRLEVEIHEVANVAGADAAAVEWLGESATLRVGSVKFTIRVLDYEFGELCSRVQVPPEGKAATKQSEQTSGGQSATLGLIVRTPGGKYDVSGLVVGTDAGTLTSFSSFLRDGEAADMAFSAKTKGGNNALSYTFAGPFTTAVYDPVLDDPCSPSPCKNQGVCQDTGAGNFRCKCPPGTAGSTCEDSLNTDDNEVDQDGEFKRAVSVIGASRKVRFALGEDHQKFFDLVFDEWTETMCDGTTLTIPFQAAAFSVVGPISSALPLASGPDGSTIETSLTTMSVDLLRPPSCQVQQVDGDAPRTTLCLPGQQKFGTVVVEMHEISGERGEPQGSISWLGQEATINGGELKLTIRINEYEFQECPEVESGDPTGLFQASAQSATLGLIVRTPGGKYDVSGLVVGTDAGTLTSFSSFLRDGEAADMAFSAKTKGGNNALSYTFAGPFTTAVYDPVITSDTNLLPESQASTASAFVWIGATAAAAGICLCIIVIVCIAVCMMFCSGNVWLNEKKGSGVKGNDPFQGDDVHAHPIHDCHEQFPEAQSFTNYSQRRGSSRRAAPAPGLHPTHYCVVEPVPDDSSDAPSLPPV